MPDLENDLEMPAPFGVFAETGELFAEITEDTIQSFAAEGPDESDEQAALQEKVDRPPTFGVDVDTDPNDLTEAGWAILYAPGVDQQIKEALQPLLDHRQAQVEDESLFQVFDEKPIGQKQKFPLQSFIGEPASKDTLDNIFTGAIPNGPPALLFSGSHGMGFKSADDPKLPDNVGALVCDDWRGRGAITPDHWYAASDLSSDARVHGLVHFLFACYGAGCPQFDNFDRANNQPKQVAPQPLLSRLPQALLAHPEGGALAVIGHVERAWAYGFQSECGGPQIQGFRNVLTKVLRGDRLGEATDDFNMRWAALSTELAEVVNDLQFGADVSPRKLANQWVARDDARNYIIFGDPAVKVRVEAMPEIV